MPTKVTPARDEVGTPGARSILLPDVLTVPDLAGWFGCSQRSARRLLKWRVVRGRKLLGRWITTRDAVLEAASPRWSPRRPARGRRHRGRP